MVQKVWKNRGATEAGFRYIEFTKQAEDSATFDASMVYGLLDGNTQDSNGVSVNALTEAAAGFVIGFKIEGFETIGSSLTSGQTNFTYLNKVLFGDSVTTLEDNIFKDSGVTTLAITRYIETIDLSVFGGSSVSNITVDANNGDFSTENEYLYTKNKSKLILCPPGNSRLTVRLNDSTTTIGEEAFIYNTTITTLYLSNVTTIETRAFKNTTALKKVYGIRSLTVGTDAFNISAAEAVVTIANGVTNRDAGSSSATITYNPAKKTATNEDQTYDVTATVTMISDNTLVATKIFSETVFAVSNSAPTFTSNPLTTATEGVFYSYEVTASDPDGGFPEITATTIPSWLSLYQEDEKLEGTPTNSDVGSHSVVLTASDGSLSTTQEFTITVANANDAPTIDYKTITVPQDPNQLEVEVRNNGDAEPSSYTYQWQKSSDNINWENITGQTTTKYEFTNDDKPIEPPKYIVYNFRVKVTFTYTDTDGTTGSQTLGAKYYDPKEWGTITIPNDKKTATVGTTYSYSPTAKDDSDLDSFFYLVEAPDWLKLEYDSKSTMTGTPKTAHIGKTQTVKIAIYEQLTYYNADFLEFKITVLPFKPADKTALQSAIDKWYDLANDSNDTNAVTTANNHEGPEYFGNPNTWDVSLITDLNFLFYGKTQDNHPDISTWNVFNVTSMKGTFSNSTFNGQLNKWNVENVTDFSYCFANNVVFNQPLFRWNTQDAATLEYMFYNAWSFNQSITRTLQYNDTDKGQIGWNKKTDLPSEEGDWTVDKINTYFTNIYGSARNGTSIKDPTTFRGVFGMWSLFLKVQLDKDDDQKVKYPLIIKDATFIELLGSLAKSVQKLISDKENTKLTQYNKLVSITNAMLQINKANDYIQGSNLDNDYKTKSKDLYTQMRLDIPFYLAWNSLKATTIAHMKHNTLTFINGEDGTVNPTLSEEIAKNPVKTLMENNYSEKTKENIEDLGQTLDTNLKETLKTVSNSNSALTGRAAAITTKKDSAPPSFKGYIREAEVFKIIDAKQEDNGDTTITLSVSAELDNGLTVPASTAVDNDSDMEDMSYYSTNEGLAIRGSLGSLLFGGSLSAENVQSADYAYAVESGLEGLSLEQTGEERERQATRSIASSDWTIDTMYPYATELTAKGMFSGNPTTGTDTGFDAAKMLQRSAGAYGLTVAYDYVSGTSITGGIDSVMESGGEMSMRVSVSGLSVPFNNGNTNIYANGETISINTDESVFATTTGSVTLSYSADFDVVGLYNTWQLQAAYTVGAMTFGAGISEESSTTTTSGNTVAFKAAF